MNGAEGAQQAIPQNADAEASVLGSVLIEEACLTTVKSLIDGGDFYKDKHRRIYHAMLQLKLTDSPIDMVSLSTALRATDDLEDIGGIGYLAELLDIVPHAANVGYHCKLVREAAVRRQAIEAGRQLIKAAFSGGDLGEGLKAAKDGISGLMAGMDSFAGVNVSDITTVDQRAETYIRQIKTLDKDRFTTGFARLDYLIRGVAPGEVMIIIAEPGGFKTALLQNLLIGGAKRTGKYSLFFSIEMPVEKVFEREAQIANSLVGREVERAYRAMGSEAAQIQKNVYLQGSKGLLVCGKPRLDIERMGRYVDLARNKFGQLGAVGIDYMGLMAAPGRTLFEKTAFIAPELKHQAKELGLPIIVLCQINREGAKQKHDIEITDAKGGGDIEASADIMLGMYHDPYGVLVCKGLKNRNGASGWRLAVEIDKPSFRFLDMVEYEQEDAPAKAQPKFTPPKQKSKDAPPPAEAPYGGF